MIRAVASGPDWFMSGDRTDAVEFEGECGAGFGGSSLAAEYSSGDGAPASVANNNGYHYITKIPLRGLLNGGSLAFLPLAGRNCGSVTLQLPMNRHITNPVSIS